MHYIEATQLYLAQSREGKLNKNIACGAAKMNHLLPCNGLTKFPLYKGGGWGVGLFNKERASDFTV